MGVIISKLDICTLILYWFKLAVMAGGLATSNTMAALLNSTLAQEIRDNAVNCLWDDAEVIDYSYISFWRRLGVGFICLPPIEYQL